jgi:ParB/RepB/Spo0J family partition protein
MRQKARKPASPAPSSTKWTAAPKGSARSAEQAAKQTFGAAPQLPLNLDATAEAGASEGRRRLTGAFLIELARIRPDPTQPRRNLDTAAQRELEDSVRQLGILQAITVRYLADEDIYQIISGERRFQAATKAALPEMPCWVQHPKETDVLLHQIVENWQRADLRPFEVADALAALRDGNGYSQKDLAKLTGKPESEISRLLSILKIEPEVQKEARESVEGNVTRRHLIALAQLRSPKQKEAFKTMKVGALTAEATEKLVQETKAKAVGIKTRGAPVRKRLSYLTPKASVSLTFRTKTVTVDAILAALDDVREQVVAEGEQD